MYGIAVAAPTWKPGARIRTHLIVAGLIWALVGLMLIVRGSLFLQSVHQVWLLAVAVAVGTVKSRLMLDRAARRNRDRLLVKSDGDCIGGVYSAKMWLLVACMIALGRLLRVSGLPMGVVGTVYGAIGWALLLSSRVLWQAAATLQT